jgi:hypothetical protein
VELYFHSPNTHSWRDAQLKSTGTTLPLTFTFNIIPGRRTDFRIMKFYLQKNENYQNVELNKQEEIRSLLKM